MNIRALWASFAALIKEAPKKATIVVAGKKQQRIGATEIECRRRKRERRKYRVIRGHKRAV